MSEELDYMSDEFLKSCAGGENDVRPGLLRSHNDIRQHMMLKKKKLDLESKKVPTEVLQAEVLEESLKQPISSTNKGFSMLEKMGFKTGMGLGKNNAGIKEPIPINIKNNKMGLGHEAPKPQAKRQKTKDYKLEHINEEEHRLFLSKQNKLRECASDFRKSQRICKELDFKSDMDVPDKSWFWPPEEKSSEAECEATESADDENSEEECELSDAEKLEILTEYLRKTYFYCIWCGVKYNDEKDMEDCPGPTREDH